MISDFLILVHLRLLAENKNIQKVKILTSIIPMSMVLIKSLNNSPKKSKNKNLENDSLECSTKPFNL